MSSYTFRKFVFVKPNEARRTPAWGRDWRGYLQLYGISPENRIVSGFEVSIKEGPKGLWTQAHGDWSWQIKHYPSIMKAANALVSRYEGRIREFFEQEKLVETYPCRKEVVINV